MNTKFYRENDDLVYQRGDSSKSFKRMDYAWRHVVDSAIYATLPDRDSSKSWFLEVFNGRFVYQKAGSDYVFVYELPEYLNQNFDPRYYGRQLLYKKETPTILGEGRGGTRLQLPSYPVTNTKELYLWVNEEPAWWGDERILAPGATPDLKTRRYNVVDADLKRGLLTIGPGLPANAKVEAWYHHRPPNYTYQGYKGKDNRFYYLDLNPTAGHVVTLESTSGNPIDFYTNELLGKTIYLYLLPAYVLHKQGDQWVQEDWRNRSVLRHSLSPTPDSLYGWQGSSGQAIAEQEGIPAKDVVKLLAEVTLSQNVALNKMSLIDTRSRGGGLRKDVRLDALGVEAQYCWDIGFWDGEPYHQNGVVVVRLPQRVLKDHGGLFSEDQVRETVEKHLEFGTLAIIEYLPSTATRAGLAIRENLVGSPPPDPDPDPDPDSLTAPANLRVTSSVSVDATTSRLEFAWDPVAGADWYHYTTDDLVWTVTAPGETSTSIAGAPLGSVTFGVRAYSAAGPGPASYLASTFAAYVAPPDEPSGFGDLPFGEGSFGEPTS